MADETLMFDLLAKDSASGSFRDLAKSAALAAGEMHAAFADPVKAKIETEGFDSYMAKLGEVKAANELAIGDIQAKAMALAEGADAAGRELDKMSAELDRAGRGADDAGRRFTNLGGTFKKVGMAFGAGPAGFLAGGALAGLVAIVGGLASALTAAAGAASILGLAVVGDVKGYSALETKITSLKTSLAGMSPTSKSYAKDQAELSKLLAQQREQYGPMVSGLHALSDAWKSFTGKTKGPVMQLIGEGLKIAADALRQFAPVANAAAKAMEPLLKQVDAWVKGSGFKDFMNYLKTTGVQALGVFARLIGTATGSLLKLMVALAPVARAVADFLGHLNGTQSLLVVGAAIAGIVAAMTGVGVAISPMAVAIGGVIAAFSAAIIVAWKNSATFRKTVVDAFHQVKAALADLITAAKGFWAKWGDDIKRFGLQELIGFAKEVGNLLSGLFHLLAAILDVFSGNWKGAWQNLKAGVLNIVKGFVDGAMNMIRPMLSIITAVWDGIKNATIAAWNWITSKITGALDTVKNAMETAWNWVVSKVTGAWDAITGAVSTGVDKVKGFMSALPGEIVGFFAGLPGEMLSIGENIMSGLINGITSKIGALASSVSSIASSIPGKIASFLGIQSPSRVTYGQGQHIMQGWINGLKSKKAELQKELSNISKEIQSALSWASSFNGNVFNAGLPTTRNVTIPGQTTTSVMNGIKITQSTPATIGTQNLTPQQMLAQMFAYEHGQVNQNRHLLAMIKKLRSDGMSLAVLQQMAAGGPQGLAEIEALAAATPAQVRQFSHLDAQATAAANNAGAYATTGHSMQQLKNQQRRDQQLVNSIANKLSHTTLHVKVAGGHKLRTTG